MTFYHYDDSSGLLGVWRSGYRKDWPSSSGEYIRMDVFINQKSLYWEFGEV